MLLLAPFQPRFSTSSLSLQALLKLPANEPGSLPATKSPAECAAFWRKCFEASEFHKDRLKLHHLLAGAVQMADLWPEVKELLNDLGGLEQRREGDIVSLWREEPLVMQPQDLGLPDWLLPPGEPLRVVVVQAIAALSAGHAELPFVRAALREALRSTGPVPWLAAASVAAGDQAAMRAFREVVTEPTEPLLACGPTRRTLLHHLAAAVRGLAVRAPLPGATEPVAADGHGPGGAQAPIADAQALMRMLSAMASPVSPSLSPHAPCPHHGQQICPAYTLASFPSHGLLTHLCSYPPRSDRFGARSVHPRGPL